MNMNATHTNDVRRDGITHPFSNPDPVHILPGDEVRLYPTPCCEGPCAHEADRGPEPVMYVIRVIRHRNNPTWVEYLELQPKGRRTRGGPVLRVKLGAVAEWLYPEGHVF